MSKARVFSHIHSGVERYERASQHIPQTIVCTPGMVKAAGDSRRIDGLYARQAYDLNFRELVPIAPVQLEFGYGKKRTDAAAAYVRAACWHVPAAGLAQGTARGWPDLDSRGLGNGLNRSQVTQIR